MNEGSPQRIWNAVGERKPLLAFSLFIGIFEVLADSVGLSLAIRNVGEAALNLDIDAVSRATVSLLAVVLVRAGVAGITGVLEWKVAEDTARKWRGNIFMRVMGGKAEYFDSHESGDMISRLTNDVEEAKKGVTTLARGIKQVFLIIAAMVGLFIWSWPFAIGLLALAGGAFLAGASTSNSLRSTSRKYQTTLAGISESATNLFGGVAVIKSLGAEHQMDERFGDAVDRHLQAARKRTARMALQRGITVAVPMLGLSGLIILGGVMVLRGVFSVADAVALVQLASRALFPLSSLGAVWANLQQNLAALDRVEEACAIPQERHALASGLPGDAPAASEVPAIEFRNVHFGYGPKPVLTGLSFKVKPGSKVALAGPSGSGKSTVLRLLLGMYDTRPGAILVGGKDITEIPLEALREMVALVPQEPWLIPGTVRDNILFGKPGASQKELAEAARAANAEFIGDLPQGFDTVLEGNNLSGGQRQRICLARAFVKNAPLLLLDEPTSAVDAESERLIRQAVERLTEGRTVITVAHTQAMVEKADVTVVLG